MMTNPYEAKILEKQARGLAKAEEQCIRAYGIRVIDGIKSIINSSIEERMCPPFWDTILCWPSTPSNTTATLPCPSYVAGFNATNNATRKCMDDGTWFVDKIQNTTWTDYTRCFENGTAKIFVPVDKYNISSISQKYLPSLKIIAETGYLVSLSTLIIAFSIMLSIKKLHCPRNILHMHLFASFMLRAFVYIFKDLVFVDGVGLPSDLIEKNGGKYFNVDTETKNWECKLITSLWQYFIIANFSWILMEGIYLHNLIFRALFANSNSNIKWYIILGWGLPLIITTAWVIAKLWVDDRLCWTTHENYAPTLILAIPIVVSILINLILFIRISIVLYSKLRSPLNEESRRYKKWIKSTLVLAPLFGVHYAIFVLIFAYSMKVSKILEFIWFVCDMLFGSFQGFFVAVLYCFLNSEVKTELRPRFYQFCTCLATNKYLKYCFPCRKKFIRSIVGRPSVCTTLSCSSLYTNGLVHQHKNNRTYRTDSATMKLKCDKNRDHVCQNVAKSLQDLSARSHKINEFQKHIPLYNYNTVAESALYVEANSDKQHENEIHEEMLRMVQNY